MIKSLFPFLAILFTFTTSRAQAQEPSVDEIVAACRARYHSTAAVAQCVTEGRFAQAEARDEQIVARLDEGEDRDRDMIARLDEQDTKLSDVQASLARIEEQTAKPAPVQTQVATASASQPVQQAVYVQGGGVPYQVVPHYAWASIYNLSPMVNDTMHLTTIGSSSSRARCGGQGATMVMLTDHGAPIRNIWAPSGAATSGFTEVYYDGNGDGQPDGGTVYALPLGSQDDVYVSWGRQDDIRVVYLRPSGQVAIPGVGYATLYRPTDASDNPASGVVACDMDENDPKTGHRAKQVSSMSRAWR